MFIIIEIINTAWNHHPKLRIAHLTRIAVYGCHSRKGADKIHFHPFPDKNSGIRVNIYKCLWRRGKSGQEKSLGKGFVDEQTSKYMRVCSKHFKTGDYFAKDVPMKQPKLKKYAVPSQNLPKKRSYRENTSKAGSSSQHEVSVCQNDRK